MKRSWPLLLALAAGVFALDFWTKRWATEALEYMPPREIIGEYVRLTFTKNSGIAFGLGAGSNFPFYVFSIIAALLILYMFARQPVQSFLRQSALGLILGGALGNLFDRLTTGEVVDFIEIGWNSWHWPIFNVADSAVTVGVVLFGLTWLRHEGASHREVDGAQDAAPSADEHEPRAESVGPRSEQRGAAGSLPGGSSD